MPCYASKSASARCCPKRKRRPKPPLWCDRFSLPLLIQRGGRRRRRRILDDDADVLGTAGASQVEELDRRVVVDIASSGEEDHLGRVALENLADPVRKLLHGQLFLVDHGPVGSDEPQNDLVLDRGWRKVRGRF